MCSMSKNDVGLVQKYAESRNCYGSVELNSCNKKTEINIMRCTQAAKGEDNEMGGLDI